ncbi:MAG: 50S ribosomal protein L13 [Puniceicoccales bacterium]|jgi:large subunit ribosomal protein L13|nr:50S ribosomal protein L13 [Puniceicoccales bacterium]
MKTTLVKKVDRNAKRWFLVDAAQGNLGRLAVKVANVLRGRHKVSYTPHMDDGDFVVVVNADKVRLTGKKDEDKNYMFYSMYQGNERRFSAKAMRVRRPCFLVEHAVKGMLPKNRLASVLFKKLKVYAGATHPHEAQNPIPLEI